VNRDWTTIATVCCRAGHRNPLGGDGVQQSDGTVTTPPSRSVDDSAAPIAPSPLADAVRQAAPRVERFCRSRFPDSYATLAVTQDQEGLIVYRRPVSGFDTAVRKEFPRLPISFQDARYSERELTAAVRRIVADIGYWRDRGVEITSVGPAGDGSSVVVTARDPGPAGDLLSREYGFTVTVQPGGDVVAIPPMDPSRLPPATSR
jgi:hypothetical protein